MIWRSLLDGTFRGNLLVDRFSGADSRPFLLDKLRNFDYYILQRNCTIMAKMKVAQQSAALVLFLIPLFLFACGMLEVGK